MDRAKKLVLIGLLEHGHAEFRKCAVAVLLERNMDEAARVIAAMDAYDYLTHVELNDRRALRLD